MAGERILYIAFLVNLNIYSGIAAPVKQTGQNIKWSEALEAYCATTDQRTQMAEERMLYIAFLVNPNIKNGIAAHIKQTGHNIKEGSEKYIDQHNYYANINMKEVIYIYIYIYINECI